MFQSLSKSVGTRSMPLLGLALESTILESIGTLTSPLLSARGSRRPPPIAINPIVYIFVATFARGWLIVNFYMITLTHVRWNYGQWATLLLRNTILFKYTGLNSIIPDNAKILTIASWFRGGNCNNVEILRVPKLLLGADEDGQYWRSNVYLIVSKPGLTKSPRTTYVARIQIREKGNPFLATVLPYALLKWSFYASWSPRERGAF